jgi:NurA-like 5'-3' nuclease
MNVPATRTLSGRPRLTVVRGTRAPVLAEARADWRRVATAVLACTYELTQHLLEQRWGRVVEAMSERRELLACMAGMPLDAEGRCSLRSLQQAADEAEYALKAMMGEKHGHR